MERKSDAVRIVEIETQISQLKERKKQLEQREKQKERKERTKRLIQIGAEVESVFGQPINQEMLPKLRQFLIDQDRRGKFFSSALLKSEDAGFE